MMSFVNKMEINKGDVYAWRAENIEVRTKLQLIKLFLKKFKFSTY
jgi:hypothetical protein